MPNLYNRVGNVRDRLRHPRANRPTDGDCLRAICDHIKILRAKRKNTGHPWDFADKRITVQQGLARYPINDVRFGTPLAVLTIDDSNPQHIQRLIPFYAPQNLAFDWGIPSDAGYYANNGDGSFHSAERVAFYWTAGVPYCEFQPTPQLTCQYLIRFLIGNTVDAMSLADEVNLGEVGDSLVEVRAAISMLEFSDWQDDKKQNMETREALARSLTWEQGLLDDQYSADILISTGSSIGRLWTPD